jgi:hypothetical protein
MGKTDYPYFEGGIEDHRTVAQNRSGLQQEIGTGEQQHVDDGIPVHNGFRDLFFPVELVPVFRPDRVLPEDNGQVQIGLLQEGDDLFVIGGNEDQFQLGSLRQYRPDMLQQLFFGDQRGLTGFIGSAVVKTEDFAAIEICRDEAVRLLEDIRPDAEIFVKKLAGDLEF